MITLCIVSAEAGTGKTAVGAGLGQHLLGNNKKVGFLKPLISDNGEVAAEDFRGDAAFMKDILTLGEPVDNLSPVIRGQSNLAGQLSEACAQVSRDKDVVLVEGLHIELVPSVAEALKARVLIVEGYSSKLTEAAFTDSYRGLGERLLGVVLNKVPKSQLERVSRNAQNLLGILPEDRALFTLTVADLAECVRGEILNSAEPSGKLVENVMLGAMIVGYGPEYFGRKANKAAIVRAERHDMQLAALETSLSCLVLCGEAAPIPAVNRRAEDRKTPIISTKLDITTAVARIENALAKTRFHQPQKLARLTEIMEQHFNFPALYQGLRLAS